MSEAEQVGHPEQVEIVETSKGMPMAICGGYKYRKKKILKNTSIFWVCNAKQCKGTLTTDPGYLYIKENNNHSCVPNFAAQTVEKCWFQCKKRAREETTALSKIFDEELSAVKDARLDFVTEIPLFVSKKASLYRNRNRGLGFSSFKSSINMDHNIILSEKGKHLVVINNYKYTFQKKLKSGEKRWTCINKKCRSYLLSMGEMDNVTVTKHIQEHCHNANVEQLNRQIVSTSCKRKAIDDLSEKPAKIIRWELQDNLPSTTTRSDVALIRRNLYNARRKILPQLPTSVQQTLDILAQINIETSTDIEKTKDSAIPTLPEQSKKQYEASYGRFQSWCEEKNIKDVDEKTVLAFFEDKSNTQKASPLWAQYFMLKSVLKTKHDVDISKYANLLTLPKRKDDGCTKNSTCLNKNHLGTFLKEADDDTYLLMKVALIIGVIGSCKVDELAQLRVEDVKDEGCRFEISIQSSHRVFNILADTTDGWNPAEMIRKYINLRPPCANQKYFFIAYKNGRCVNLPVSKGTIGFFPKKIATFLRLPDPQSFVGYRSEEFDEHIKKCVGQTIP